MQVAIPSHTTGPVNRLGDVIPPGKDLQAPEVLVHQLPGPQFRQLFFNFRASPYHVGRPARRIDFLDQSLPKFGAKWLLKLGAFYLQRTDKVRDPASCRRAAAGYLAIAPEPRGWSGSSRSVDGLTLTDLADDIAAVILEVTSGPVTLVGHDFGGQVARTVATLRPSLVKNMVLLATPGPGRPKPEPATAHRRTFVPELSTEEHLEAVALAFFAVGNDPVVWVDGWNRLLASAQLQAMEHTPAEAWVAGGTVPTLLVRPAADCLVSPESTRQLATELGGRVSLVEVPEAGHALLPEQPEAVAISVLTWLRRQG